MASCNFAKPNVCGQMKNWLRFVVILSMTILLKEACAKTVLHNKSGRHLVLIVPHSMRIEMPMGQSVEIEGAQQQKGVMIQDAESGGLAGPLDLPDNRSLEVVWLDPSTSTAVATLGIGGFVEAKGNACIGDVLSVMLGKPGECH